MKETFELQSISSSAYYSSQITLHNEGLPPSLRSGLRWIISKVFVELEALQERIKRDTILQKDKEKQEKEEKRKRVEAFKAEEEQRKSSEKKTLSRTPTNEIISINMPVETEIHPSDTVVIVEKKRKESILAPPPSPTSNGEVVPHILVTKPSQEQLHIEESNHSPSPRAKHSEPEKPALGDINIGSFNNSGRNSLLPPIRDKRVSLNASEVCLPDLRASRLGKLEPLVLPGVARQSLDGQK
jgi:hypothetical protein